MKTTSVVLVVALLTASVPLPANAQPSANPERRELIKNFAMQLPVGSGVRVRLTDGRNFKGMLMGAEADRIIVKPKTRVPEPERFIPYTQIDSVEIQNGGMTTGKAALIGAASGAATFFGLLLSLFAAFGDD